MVLLVGLTAAEIRVPLPTIVSVVNTMLTSKKHVINMENDSIFPSQVNSKEKFCSFYRQFLLPF